MAIIRTLCACFGVNLYGKKVLEMGCSTGALMELLEQQGADVFGIDVASKWSDHYYYAHEKRMLVDLQNGSVPPSLRQTSFDFAIAQELIEHIKRPYDFLGSVRQLLSPHGHLLLTTPNLAGVTAIIKRQKWCGVTTEGHTLLYTPRSLSFTVCNCGFREVHTITNLIPIVYQTRYPWLWWINRTCTWTKIGGGIVALYQRT